MAASTHRSRQSRVRLGLLVAVLMLLPSVGALARTVRINLGEQRKSGIEFLMKQRGISREAADRLARQYELKNGSRILDYVDVPEGAQLDFWKVRNHPDPAKRVEFGGRGTIVDATSYLGRNYKELLFGLLNTSQRQDALALLKQARDTGFMIIPTAMQTGPGTVNTAAAQTFTIGVIVPEFPHWIDMRPVGNGTPGQRSGTFYQSNVTTPPGVKVFPIRPGGGGDGGPLGGWNPSDTSIHNYNWEEWPGEYYADSPGGPINTSGMPLGLANNTSAWSGSGVTATTNADGHPHYGGDERPGSVYAESPLQLRQRLYDLFFNKALTSSLYTWFYNNTHAHISVEGSPSSIIGWIDDHHVLDRLPRGSSNYYAVQPGTPFLRPQDPNGPGIVRASLWQNGSTNGLTLFFRKDVDNLSLGQIQLTAFQTQDVDSATSGTQTGNMVIDISSSGRSTIYADPWDHRRWTITDSDWEFVDQGDATKRIDFVLARGSSWSCQVSGHAGELGASPVTWNNASTGYRNQGQGCGDFPAYQPLPGVNVPRTLAYTGDTVSPRTATGVVNSDDTVGSQMGNRLMSFCYYAHNGSYGDPLFSTFSSSGSAYQLQTLRNSSGETDPIAGYVDDSRDRAPRFYPFDHDMRDHSFPNMGGYFGTSSQYHTDAQCWADVTQVMEDQGITYDNYDQLILMYPGEEEDARGGESRNRGGFIAHSGNPIPVSTGAGVLLLAHEICHNFGAGDLYDLDFYTNNGTPPPSPPLVETWMMAPYTVMSFGGFRLDAWHKLKMGYATPTNVLRDLGFTRIDQVEQTTADPVILKLPANPLSVYASKNPTKPAGFAGSQADWDRLADPDQWNEYFLIENRNVMSGAYAGDRSPRGLYIYHIDERTGQSREDWHAVKLVQADGSEDLETVQTSQALTTDMLNGDPYPGSTANRFFTERSQRLINGRNSPTSWSNGVPDSGGANIMANTPTDSFVRVTNISGPSTGPGGTPNAAGDPMTAFIYVEPAEVVVTGQTLIPAPPPGQTFYEVQQGTKDFPVLLLNLNNSGVYPNLSTNPVTINTLRVYEVGTSLQDDNIAVAKLYEDSDKSGALELGNDTLLKAAAVSGDYIDFTNLGYTIQLNEDRNLIVAYDIAENAQTSPTVTVGAELTTHDFVAPNHPGAVQQRVRLTSAGPGIKVNGGDGYTFGDYRFPIPGSTNRTARIVESPDTLTVDTFNLAPATAVQGSFDVPIMRLQLSVNHDAVTLSEIQVTQTGTAIGGTDVSIVRAYHDMAGNGVIDAGDTLLGEAAVIGPTQAGVANIGGLSFDVTDLAQQHIILAVNITPDATAAATVQLQLQAACMTLQQNPTDLFPDQVDYSNFPHTHADAPDTVTQIIPGNRPPYAPPAPNHATYGSDWSPRGGTSVEDPQPVCTFPRARGISAAPPNDDPDPDTTYDTADLMSYQVQFSTDPTFSTIARTETVNPPHANADVLTFQVGAPLAPAQYYWRARTIDTQGAQSPWSAPAAVFVVANRPTPPTGPFSPVSVPPGSGNTVISVAQPTYSWTLGTDVETPASQMRTIVQVDDNADFSSPLFEAWSQPGANTSVGWVVQAGVGSGSDVLTRGVHYYWRAQSLDGANTVSGWTTATLDFKVGENLQPTAPQPPFAPADDQVVTSANPTLIWGASSDPDPEDSPANFTYYVQLDDDSDWTDGNLFEGQVDPPIAGSPISLSLTPAIMPVPLVDNGHYFWRVRTRDRAGVDGAISDWSSTLSFYVNLQNDPPKAPTTGFSPVNATRISDTTPDLSCDPTVDPDPPNNPDPMGQIAGYQFRLKYEPADPGTWDPDADFDYQYTSGTNQAAVTTPLTDPLPNGRWYWAVRARDDFGAWSPWSVSLYFRLNRPPTPPPTPGPTPDTDWVPANGAAVIPTPTCQFPPGDDPDETDDPSNLTYRVEFSQDAAFDTVFAANIYTVLPNLNDLSVVTFQVTNALATGTWYWRVQAFDQAGATSAYSQVHSFLVDNPPSPPQAPFAPSGNSDAGRFPVYQWVIGADPDPADLPATLVTVIEVDDNIDFTSPEYGGEVDSAPGAASLDSFAAGLTELRPGITYYWRAKTRDQAGLESGWSAVQSFVVVDNTAPDPPRNMWPNSGQETDQLKPIIYWDAATDPDDAQDVLRYEIQLDDNTDWSDANVWEGTALGTDIRVLDGRVFVEVDSAAQPANEPLQDNTLYYYRIRTIDPAAQTSDWSTVQNFWVNSENNPPEAPATGFSPSNGEVVFSLPAVLRCNHAFDPDPYDPTWPGGPYLTYIYQLRRDSAPTDANFTYQYTVVANTPPNVQAQVQAMVTGDLGDDDPNSEHPWYWRVRAVDDQGAQSPWSSVQHFYLDTANQPPTLSPSGSYTQALTPKYGNINPPTHFSFEVVYTDAENDAPVDIEWAGQTGAVWLELDGDPTKRIPMRKLDDTDNNYANGVTYIAGLNADDPMLGIGTHHFTFYTAGWMVQWPPLNPVNPPANFDLWGQGPIIGTTSGVAFTDGTWDAAAIPDPGTPPDVVVDAGYEEGLDVIRVQLTDADKAGRGQIQVTLYTDPGQAPMDVETLTLTEDLGQPAGTFRGQMAVLGRAEQPGDPELSLPQGDPGRVLNVISGAGGNLVTVQYQDPDEGADFPGSMQRDISTDRALVVDTTAPPAIPDATLQLATGTNAYGNSDGQSIDVSWAGYLQAGPPYEQVDIVGYELYLSDTGPFDVDLNGGVVFNPAGAAVLVATLSPNQTSYTVTGSEPSLVGAGIAIDPNQTYHIAVVPVDEVPNREVPVSSKAVTTADTQHPVLFDESPTDGSVEVPLAAPISFRLEDAGTGIDESTLRVLVRRAPAGSAPGTGTWYDINADPFGLGWQRAASGTLADRTYTFNYAPGDPNAGSFFALNQRVEVQVICDDLEGNTLDTWAPVPPFTQLFTYNTKSDLNPPQVTNLSPADGATNVLPTTPITFRVTDDIAGVDTSTIMLQVNGQPIGAAQGLVIDDTDPLNVSVSYPAPTADVIPWGATITVRVWASDLAGNAIPQATPVEWSYETQADTSGPAMDIAALAPAAGAANVPIGTDVSFRLSDDLSGVAKLPNGDWDVTVYVKVGAAGETQVPYADLQFTGTARALRVTYNPPADFSYEDVVAVRVVANDAAGNPLGDESPVIGLNNGFEWSFTCVSPPRYRIAGTIVDQDGKPLPGVVVTAWEDGQQPESGQQVTTDGNGTYIVQIQIGGTFNLRPELPEYSFEPVERQVVVAGADVLDQDFVGTLQTYSIKGTIVLDGAGLEGVTVSTTIGGATVSVLTDANGDYEIPDVPSGRYTITPQKVGYTFRPGGRTRDLAGADLEGIDFEAVANTYSISGTVRNWDGERMAGVRISDGSRSTVTNDSGEFTLSDVPSGTVDLTASKTGYKLLPESQRVTVPPDATAVDFTAYVSFANSFPAADDIVNMIGVPCHPADTDPDSVFGDRSDVVRWNPLGNPPAYVFAGVGALNQDVVNVQPGRGFFVRLRKADPNDETKTIPNPDLEVAGRPVTTARPFTLSLGPIWNMAANPYTTALPYANIVPATADSVRNYGYVYDATLRNYLLVSSLPGINVARTHVLPWEGIWLRTNGGSATVNMQAPVGTTDAPVSPQALDLGKDGWALPIVARAGGSIDTTTAVGVGPALSGAFQIFNPPMAPGSVDVFIRSADGTALAQDVKPDVSANPVWTLTVATDIPGAQVELSMPDLSRVPNDMGVYLTDLETGKRMYARTMTSYRFEVGAAGGSRDFKLEVAPKSGAGLVITAAVATAGVQGTVVTYNVSKDCQVTADVLNVAGRVVRTLCSARDAAPGVNTLSWDLTSSQGTRVPSGRYMIRISAASEDGQQVTAVTSANVSR